jgi:uracil permease
LIDQFFSRRNADAYLEGNIQRFNDHFRFYRAMGIVSPDITLPIMFVFMGLALLTNAKEHYDKGAKKDAMLFAGLAIFVFIITAYNLISRFM